MCGIAGFINEGRPAPGERVLRRMLRIIRYRGPDETGVYLDNNAGLGHARLSIIDLAGGSQPMHNEDGSLWIVFNGEIFNYVELREELIARGHRFATRSDTEVILHLFEDLGEACVSRLNGQWAFAIWDTRSRRLFLSRDRFGVRPLFFARPNGAFVFASEIKALFLYPGVSRLLDLQALDEIFTFWHTLPPRTAFLGISQIPPGHSAFVANGNVTLQRHWDLDYALGAASHSGRQYAEELLALLRDATRLRLRSDVPVAAYLSGGLDSTLIAALVKDSGVARLKTFSVRFEDSEMDEGPYQAEAVLRLGADHQAIRCSNREIGNVFPEVVWHMETPVLRTAPVPLYLLSKLVRQNGYKVVLTGEGSDELLGGYDIFKEVKIREFCVRQPLSRLRPLLFRRLYPYMPWIQSQPASYLKAFFHAAPNDTLSPFFSHLPRWSLTSRLKCFFSDAVKAELAACDSIRSLEQQMPPPYEHWDAFTRAQYIEARYLLPGYILSSQGDRVAMAHSVEGRYPFLDHRIAEFAARLPSGLKMHVLNEKYLLKKVAAPLVPPAAICRHKQPYRAPDARSLFCDGGHEYVEELLAPERIRRDRVFNPAAVQKLVAKAKSGNMIGAADNMAVTGVISTQLLIDRFVNHFDPAAQPAPQQNVELTI